MGPNTIVPTGSSTPGSSPSSSDSPQRPGAMSLRYGLSFHEGYNCALRSAGWRLQQCTLHAAHDRRPRARRSRRCMGLSTPSTGADPGWSCRPSGCYICARLHIRLTSRLVHSARASRYPRSRQTPRLRPLPQPACSSLGILFPFAFSGSVTPACPHGGARGAHGPRSGADVLLF